MLSLVLAQALGLMHRSLHNAAHADPASRIAQTALPHDAPAHAHLNWVGELFAHQDGDTVCRLLDHQTSFDGVCASSACAPAVPCRVLAAASPPSARATQGLAWFDARGPPLSL